MSTLRTQLAWEARALSASRTPWVGVVCVAAFEFLFVGLTTLDRVRPALIEWVASQGYVFDDVFSGLTLAQHLVGFAVAGPGAVCIALVAGQSIAGEWEQGTLRGLLCRPVSRPRLWGVKLVVCLGYGVALVVWASVLALGLGLAARGAGPLLVHVPATRGRWLYAFGDGLFLYAWGTVFHALAMCTVTSLAFALSGTPLRAATAAAVALAYLLGEDALRQLPFFAPVRGWFVMSHVTAWSRVFDAAADWRWVGEVYGPLAAFDVTVLALGLLAFTRRDFSR